MIHHKMQYHQMITTQSPCNLHNKQQPHFTYKSSGLSPKQNNNNIIHLQTVANSSLYTTSQQKIETTSQFQANERMTPILAA